eukprot:757087-Hanusia_phi.AAC.1
MERNGGGHVSTRRSPSPSHQWEGPGPPAGAQVQGPGPHRSLSGTGSLPEKSPGFDRTLPPVFSGGSLGSV